MTVPANLAALSTTPSSNPPAGTDAVFPELDDQLRTIYAFLAQLRDQKFAVAGGTINGTTTWVGGGAGVTRIIPGSASESSYLSLYDGADIQRGYIILPLANTHIAMGGNRPWRFVDSPPESSVAASSATQLTRKQEMDAAILAASLLASPIGTIKAMADLTPPQGWLMVDGRTIGNASSGATSRANADTQALFTKLWSFDPSAVPIYTSAGALSTRGASAAADFAANKRIGLFLTDGGHFLRMWTPGQSIDSGRTAGTLQGDAIRNITGQIGPGVTGETVGASGAFTAINVGTAFADGTGKQSYQFNFNAALQVPTAAENRPNSLAMPHYIRYA